MFILSRIKFCLNQEQVIDHTTRQSLFMLLFISHVSHCSYYTSVTVHATRLSLFMPHVCLCSYDTSVTIHVTRQSLFVSPASHCSDHKSVTVHVTLHSLFRSDVSHCSYHSLVTVHITRPAETALVWHENEWSTWAAIRQKDVFSAGEVRTVNVWPTPSLKADL